jgi:tRNA U34 2-thiouridine synthase MnmA/TrmU
VPGEKFKRVLFPLGNLLKTEVRKIALKIGLPVAQKKDSTGICFVGEVRVEDFLKQLGVKEKKGEVVIRSVIGSPSSVFSQKSAGYQFAGSGQINREPINQNPTTENRKQITDNYQVVGSHRGAWFYTIGQRHGFEITQWPPVSLSLRGASRPARNAYSIAVAGGRVTWQSSEAVQDKPILYVIEKDIKKNRLIVGFGAECYRSEFEVGECNWLSINVLTHQRINASTHCFVRIRHGGELIECTLTAKRQSLNAKIIQSRLSISDYRFTVALKAPQRGVAPGQSAVFYLPRRSSAKAGDKNGIVLGGGVIQ